MSRTVIDLDDDLVAEVARALGTRTKKDTVNSALREVLENRRRAVALTRLREATADGAFDLTLLADKAELPPVTAAQFLIDTSALARLLRPGAESFGWDQAAAAGLIAVCPITELEFFYSARSAADREQGIQDLRSLFGWVPVHDRAFARAWEVQGDLTSQGQHRSAGPGGPGRGRDRRTARPDAAPPRPRLRRGRAGHRPAPPLVRISLRYPVGRYPSKFR